MLQAKGKDPGKARISVSNSWLHETPQIESECEKCCDIYGKKKHSYGSLIRRVTRNPTGTSMWRQLCLNELTVRMTEIVSVSFEVEKQNH